MKQWLIIFFIVKSLLLFSQLSQPARWEAENKFSDEAYSIISLKEEGLALIRDTEKYNNGNRIWEIVILDVDLEQVWTDKIELDTELRFLGYEHLPGRLNLMFRKNLNDRLSAEILDLKLNNFEISRTKTEVKFQLRLTHYTVVEENSVFGGYVGNEPVITIFNPKNNTNFIVPGFFLAETELLDVRPNKNNTFSILLFQKVQGKRQLIFRAFDKSGNILLEDNIKVDDNKVILSGAASVLQHDEVLIGGAYGFKNDKQASGIFTCLIDPFSDQLIHYEEFPQFNHFLDYLPDRKAGKIKEKVTKRTNEKPPLFKTNVGIHRIEEFASGFAIFGESYLIASGGSSYSAYSSPSYNPNTRTYGSPYSYQPFSSRYYNNPYQYPSNTTYVPSEMRMLEGFVIAYDFSGKRLWDYSIPMNELKAPSLEQVSDVSIVDNVPHFVFKDEDKLKFSNHAIDSAQVIEPSEIFIQLKNEFEQAKDGNELEGNIRNWYGNNFYVWGVHRVKDSRDRTGDSRRVFFINKIKID